MQRLGGKGPRNEVIQIALTKGDPVVVFQPICLLTDNSVVGVEALSRFACASGSGTAALFADAHAIGLGVELEMSALRNALTECEILPSCLTLNINLSPETIVAADILGAIQGADRHRIVIEITEHARVIDYHPLLVAVRRIQDAGVKIAVDDTGAGYSSLRHVLILRPDIVKLDLSLVRDIDCDTMRQALVAALIDFGRRTQIEVIAEGVQTMEELRTLQQLGIPKAQGYLFGRPIALRELLARKRCWWPPRSSR